MKRITMMLAVLMVVGPVMAHNRTMVRTLKDALAARGGAGAVFTDVKLPAGTLRVLKLRKAVQGGQVFFQFSATGDWGPFTGLITMKGGLVVALDILSYTRHKSDGLTRPAFLAQFIGLDMAEFHQKQFVPVPGEPQNLEAIKEALMLAYHDGAGMMFHHPGESGSMSQGTKADTDTAGQHCPMTGPVSVTGVMDRAGTSKNSSSAGNSCCSSRNHTSGSRHGSSHCGQSGR